MISVVVPLYNKESFITETVTSVLEQTFTEFELIVVNDASTDNSLERLAQFDDTRLQVYSIGKAGVSEARNYGISKSNYEWIAFLDADDWWDTTFLEELTKAVERYPQQQLFASGRSRVFCDRIERYQNQLLPEDGDTGLVNFYNVIRKNLPLINSSNALMHRRSIINAGGFHPKQKMHEDHDLWIRLCTDKEVVVVNKNLSYHRNTEEDSASKQYYHPSDFIIYLKTLLEVRDQLSKMELAYFNEYCNRFILLTYIKYYSGYSRDEDKQVYEVARQLLSGSHLFLLRFLRKFPIKNTYGFFKIFQK